MLITLSSVRGSPGVTSWALLLTAAWPAAAAPTRVLVEADCAGGVLGARYQLGVDPGAVTLISACRHGGERLDPTDHGRRLGDGLWVVPGPEIAEQAVPAWSSGAADVASRLAADGRLWLADCGRVGPVSPLRPLVEAAALNLVLTGPAVEDLVQLPSRVAGLGGGRVVVLIVGRPGHSPADLGRFLGGTPVWIAPAADRLPRVALAALGSSGRARRGPVWRAAVELADEMATLLPPTGRPGGRRRPAPLRPADRARSAAAGRPEIAGWPVAAARPEVAARPDAAGWPDGSARPDAAGWPDGSARPDAAGWPDVTGPVGGTRPPLPVRPGRSPFPAEPSLRRPRPDPDPARPADPDPGAEGGAA